MSRLGFNFIKDLFPDNNMITEEWIAEQMFTVNKSSTMNDKKVLNTPNGAFLQLLQVIYRYNKNELFGRFFFYPWGEVPLPIAKTPMRVRVKAW